MAMTRKNFDAMASTTAECLVDIKSSDKTLANLMREEILDMIVLVVNDGAHADTDTRFDSVKFRQAVWARVAQHDA